MKLLSKIRSGLYWLWRIVFPRRGRVIEGKATVVADIKRSGRARGERHYPLHTGKRQTRKQRKGRWQRLLNWRAKCARFLRNRTAQRVDGKIIYAGSEGPDNEMLNLHVVVPGCPIEQLGTIYLDGKPITIDTDTYGTDIFAGRFGVILDSCEFAPWKGDAMVKLRLKYDTAVFGHNPPQQISFDVLRKRRRRETKI